MLTNQALSVNVRPADTTFRMPVAEQIVVGWIERIRPAPVRLSHLVRQYRDLEWFVDEPEIADRMNTLYDQLVAAATANGRVSVAVQIRRLTRRDSLDRKLAQLIERADRLTYTERCNRAIELWRKGARA